MCAGAAWQDVRILNMSSRGMMLRASASPVAGSYVEVRRAHHVIVARVVWSSKHQFGVRTQDSLSVEAVVAGAVAPASTPGDVQTGKFERRAVPRRPSIYDDSRVVARHLELTLVAVLGCSAAFGAYATVQDAFAKPMALVSAGLAGQKPPVAD